MAKFRMKTLLGDRLNLSPTLARSGPVSLGAMVRKIVDAHALEHSERMIDVEAEGNWPTINSDPEQRTQGFDNFPTIAAKFGCREGAGRIMIGARKEDRGIRIFVKVGGLGISQEYREKVFQLFHRLKSDKEETGIGMAIAKRIVELRAPRIWVDSTPGNEAGGDESRAA